MDVHIDCYAGHRGVNVAAGTYFEHVILKDQVDVRGENGAIVDATHVSSGFAAPTVARGFVAESFAECPGSPPLRCCCWSPPPSAPTKIGRWSCASSLASAFRAPIPAWVWARSWESGSPRSACASRSMSAAAAGGHDYLTGSFRGDWLRPLSENSALVAGIGIGGLSYGSIFDDPAKDVAVLTPEVGVLFGRDRLFCRIMATLTGFIPLGPVAHPLDKSGQPISPPHVMPTLLFSL